jgi:hypothetical protein
MFFFSGHHHQVLLSEGNDMQKWVSWFGFKFFLYVVLADRESASAE